MSRRGKRGRAPTQIDNQKEIWWRTTAFWIGLGGLIIGAVTVGLTYRGQVLSGRSQTPVLSAEVEAVSPIAPNSPIQYKATIENVGSSVAKSVSPQFGWQIIHTSFPKPLDYTLLNRARPNGIADIAPGKKITLLVDKYYGINDVQYSEFESGRDTFYVFGRAKFKDVYDSEHEFHFCKQLVRRPDTASWAFVACSFYNDTE